MSRRHHGRPHHHAPGGPDRTRRAATSPAPSLPNTPFVPPAPPTAAAIVPAPELSPPPADLDGAGAPMHHSPIDGAPPTNGATHAYRSPVTGPATDHAPANGAPMNGEGANGGERTGQCTAPQLRRFIKSRPYVPMHELRRRFGINGADDEVTPVKLEPGWVYVGLPFREGGLLGELLRAGEIGYELSLDPRTPIVIGVYPMRPIPRS
jgi:hypothetical protein